MVAYLASPYSHPNDILRNRRFMETMHAVAILTKKGEMVYSPIVECHEMARLHDLPTDAEYWKRRNFAMIDAFKKVWVLCLPGWVESVGVQMEIAYASEKGYEIRYFILTSTITTPRYYDVIEANRAAIA